MPSARYREVRVKVSAKAKKENIENIGEGKLRIAVREPREGGRANERVRELVSLYFHVPVARVHIVRGVRTENKIIRISQ